MIFAAGLALVALVLVARLFERLRHVDERFDTIQARLLRIEEALRGQAAGPHATAIATPVSAPPCDTPPPVAAQPPAAVRRDVVPPVPAAAAQAQTTRSTSDLESEIGSRWVLVAGVLVLVLGVAFFIKYAFDRHWISETLRVSIGTVVGAAIWLAGVRLAGRGYTLYGRMVAGGGLAVLYLAAYAAGVLYGIVPAGVALAWMAALSGVTVVTADRQDSVGLATMAIALGFAAPFLVASGQDHHVVLFVYDTALVAATLLLLRRHDWLFLALVSFWLTWTTFAGWWSDSYRFSYFVSTEIYLTAIGVMFLVILNELRRSRHQLATLVRSVLWIGPFLYHCASVAVLYDHAVWLLVYFIALNSLGVALLKDRARMRLALWVGAAAPFLAWAQSYTSASWYVATLAVAAGLYTLHLVGQMRALDAATDPALPEMMLFHMNGLGLFAWVYPAVYANAGPTATLAAGLSLWNGVLALESRRRSAAGPVPHALALAFAFAAIAVGIGLAGPWMTLAWAAEGAAVICVGLVLGKRALRYGGAFLIALATCRLVVTQFGVTTVSFTLLLNSRTSVGAFIVALLYAVAVLHRRYRDTLGGQASSWIAGLVAAANVLTVALLTADINSFWEVRGEQFTASFAREASISVTWAAYGMGLIALGFNRQSAVLRYLALALLGITVAKLFAVDLLALDGIYRITGFIVLGLVLLAASFLYNRASRRALVPTS